MARPRNAKQTIRAAAGRKNGNKGGKGKNKGKGREGVSRSTMDDIRYGFGAERDPGSTWARMNQRQRKVTQRIAKRSGSTVSGLLGGGPRALQEKSGRGLTQAATRTVNTAYKGAEADISERETKAMSIRDKQVNDENLFNMWMAGEQAKQRTQASAADEALRSRFREIAAAQTAGFDQAIAGAGQGPAATSSGGAAEREKASLDLGKVVAQGLSAASQVAAERDLDASQERRQGLARAVSASAIQNRALTEQDYRNERRSLGEERKELGLARIADLNKELARLKDQQIEVAQAGREHRLLQQELGVKMRGQELDAREAAAEHRLDWANYKLKVSDQQIDAALRRVDQRLKRADLSRKERADLSLAQHRLAQEQQARASEEGRNRRFEQGEAGKDRRDRNNGGGGDNAATAGERKVWAGVEEGRNVATTYMRRTGDQSREGVMKYLRSKGFGAVLAAAAAELVTKGGIGSTTRSRLRSSGGYTPRRWRN